MPFHKARALKEAEKFVAQGKIAQAIRQYQDILDDDPSDVSLLNTMGDLYIRERNITEGLRQFHKLAEAYMREGFNVKAIAIYRKIAKVDTNSVDTLLKLGELYQLQGLSREAREQYLQATEFFKRRNQPDRALEVLRKLVQLDPDNLKFRSRLATECELIGKPIDAAQAYLESAEILLRRSDPGAAEAALKKAAELDPKSSQVQILQARVAMMRQQPAEAERIINASPELQSNPEGKRILLDSYLGAGKLSEAEKLGLELFQANPMDLAPVARVSALLVEKGDSDEAYQLLAGVTEPLIARKTCGPLLEALRRIWNKTPRHLPTLELIHRICEQTADESTLPEVLEALGRAHEEAGNLEKAEAAYLKLAEREPENENYRGLLSAVQRKLGREVKPVEFAPKAVALAAEEEPPPEPAGVDAKQEAMVKEALENSDLFSRYNLALKAIAELEKVLQVYPDQIDIHQRILEISHKGYPQRGAVAAAQLARIFTNRGDFEAASKYQASTPAIGATPEIPPPSPPPSAKVEEPGTPPSERMESRITTEMPIPAAPSEETAAAPAAPPAEPVSLDHVPPALSEPVMELDLSGDLEALTASDFQAATPQVPELLAPSPVETPAPVTVPVSSAEQAPPEVVHGVTPTANAPTGVLESPPALTKEAVPVDLEASRTEVEFYLENSLVDEARRAVASLEEKYPGSPLVAELSRRLKERAGEARPAQLPAHDAPKDYAAVAEPAAEVELVDKGHSAVPSAVVPQAEPQAGSSPPPEPETPAHEEWELPTSYAVIPHPGTAMASEVHPPVAKPEAPAEATKSATTTPAHEPGVEKPVVAESSGANVLGDLAGDLASSTDALTGSAKTPSATPAASSVAPAPPPPGPLQGAAQLSGLLEEMEDSDAAAAAQDDPETHYNLGVAFREMGLLDEAIGEFQKVVRGAGKGNFPSNFLQACSLLAICFMEKKMPAIAVRWYLRALETPGLEEEAVMALQYDLGMAYEQAGDSRSALERFTEVYSQNIDFRDVAEKIRVLHQKA